MTPSAEVGPGRPVAMLPANLPFVAPRRFVVGPRRADEHLGWGVPELLLFGALALAVGFGLEMRVG